MYINWLKNGAVWIIMKISLKFPYKSDYSLGTRNLIWFLRTLIKNAAESGRYQDLFCEVL
jgi:hypothetical protein